MNPLKISAVTLAIILGVSTARAWDYEGHRLVNELALASLPTNFPAFVKESEAAKRISFLAGEPDRWRNVMDVNHNNVLDHFIDLEELEDYGMDEHNLTHFRYDAAVEMAEGRKAHPEKFKPIDPAFNKDHTRAMSGLLPWRMYEDYQKLRSEFSYLKAFQKFGGTEDEIKNAEENIIYTMGVMGHYVGDGSQPLHTTKYFNGWVGENPQGFTTQKIHSKIDSYFTETSPEQFEHMKAQLHTAVSPLNESGVTNKDIFAVFEDYLLETNKKVVPLYQLEKDGKLFGATGSTPEGWDFLSKQIVIGGQMLGDIWVAAWQDAPEPTIENKDYLAINLKNRKHPPL